MKGTSSSRQTRSLICGPDMTLEWENMKSAPQSSTRTCRITPIIETFVYRDKGPSSSQEASLGFTICLLLFPLFPSPLPLYMFVIIPFFHQSAPLKVSNDTLSSWKRPCHKTLARCQAVCLTEPSRVSFYVTYINFFNLFTYEIVCKAIPASACGKGLLRPWELRCTQELIYVSVQQRHDYNKSYQTSLSKIISNNMKQPQSSNQGCCTKEDSNLHLCEESRYSAGFNLKVRLKTPWRTCNKRSTKLSESDSHKFQEHVSTMER